MCENIFEVDKILAFLRPFDFLDPPPRIQGPGPSYVTSSKEQTRVISQAEIWYLVKANTIRDVAYAAATVNNAPFRHYRGSLLSIGQKLRIIFIPRCHNKSFDDVTAELGPFSLNARSRVKEARKFPNWKIHEKNCGEYVRRKKYLGVSYTLIISSWCSKNNAILENRVFVKPYSCSFYQNTAKST